mgnify:CR=1 FL=1
MAALGVERVSPAGIIASDTDGQVLTSRDRKLDWETPAGAVVPGPWGDGQDGDLHLSEPYGFSQERSYGTISFEAGGALQAQGFPIRCQVLDLRNTDASAIRMYLGIEKDGTAGAGAVPGTAGEGAQPYPPAAEIFEAMLGGGGDGGAGGALGNDGADAATTLEGAAATGNGGEGGFGGDDGSGSQFGGDVLTPRQRPVVRYEEALLGYYEGSASPYGRAPIGGGGGGGGGGSSAAACGGGAGGGGGCVAIYAGTIIVDATTGVGAINVRGGNAGDGSAGAAPNDDGAGGGGGGGGGWVYVVHGGVTGYKASAIIADGGTGGDGGDGVGTGTGGMGGYGGQSGRVTIVDLSAGTAVDAVPVDGQEGAAGVGTVGGAGGAGGAQRVNLGTSS